MLQQCQAALHAGKRMGVSREPLSCWENEPRATAEQVMLQQGQEVLSQRREPVFSVTMPCIWQDQQDVLSSADVSCCSSTQQSRLANPLSKEHSGSSLQL